MRFTKHSPPLPAGSEASTAAARRLRLRDRICRYACAAILIGFFVLKAFAQQSPVSSTNNVVPQLIPFSGVARELDGKPLRVETQNVQADAAGNYSVQLGATVSSGIPNDLFVSGEARWPAVQISGQVDQARIMLLSAPYALKAGDAATVGGLPPSAFMLATSPVGASSDQWLPATLPAR